MVEKRECEHASRPQDSKEADRPIGKATWEREREREKHTPVVQSLIIWCLYYKTKHNVFFMKQIQLYMAIKRWLCRIHVYMQIYLILIKNPKQTKQNLHGNSF